MAVENNNQDNKYVENNDNSIEEIFYNYELEILRLKNENGKK
jgi:hypothetical protein